MTTLSTPQPKQRPGPLPVQPPAGPAQRLTPPGRLLATAWAMLALLLLVFGRDIGGWAEASDNPLVTRLAPPAVALRAVTERSGIQALRDQVQSAVRGVLDKQIYLGSIEEH